MAKKQQHQKTVPLADTSDFVRDMSSGAVVLTSREQLDKYQTLKKAAKEEKAKLEALKSDVSELKAEIASLKKELKRIYGYGNEDNT